MAADGTPRNAEIRGVYSVPRGIIKNYHACTTPGLYSYAHPSPSSKRPFDI